MPETLTERIDLQDDEVIGNLTLGQLKSSDFRIVYEELVDTINKANEIKKKVEDKIKELMEQDYLAKGETKLKGTAMNFVFIPSYVKESFDSAKLKKEHPDLYENYKKVGLVKASLRITLKEGGKK